MSNRLSALNDNELLARLGELRRRERETTIEILQHLNKVERRKLHLRLGYSSMFTYCTGHLRYSESAAGRRVQAARCVAKFPQVTAFLQRGDVSLSTLGLIANLLTDQSVDGLLERIRGKSQRDVEAIASTFRPPIRLRDRVRRVNVSAPVAFVPLTIPSPSSPTRPLAPLPALVNLGTNSRCGSEESPSDVESVPKLYIQFLADEEFMRAYHEACALLSNRIPKLSFASVFGTVLKEFIARNNPRARKARRESREMRMRRKTPLSSDRPRGEDMIRLYREPSRRGDGIDATQ
jgi:hypothetical protein